MVDIKSITFDFIYAENYEKIFEKSGKYNKKEKILISENDIGTCFCSILNDKNKIIVLKQAFNKEYINKYTNKIKLINNIKEIIDETYNKLININKYFEILLSVFDSMSKYSQKTYRLDKIEDIYNYNMQSIDKALDNIIDTITSFERISTGNLTFKQIKIPKCSMVSISNDNKLYEYTYKIHTLEELLSVSFYILVNHKYHIKQCIYPHCNKFFITKLGQVKYCNNPCPADNSQTCRTIRKSLYASYDTTNISQEHWESRINNLYNDVNSSREFFNYYIRKSKNKREINMLKRNKEKFTNTLKQLIKYIKGCSDNEKRDEYIKIYEEFVKNVKNNQKLSTPIFKVKIPKF